MSHPRTRYLQPNELAPPALRFIALGSQHCIIGVNLTTGTQTVVAGDPFCLAPNYWAFASGNADGPAHEARFNNPTALAMDTSGGVQGLGWCLNLLLKYRCVAHGRAGQRGSCLLIASFKTLNLFFAACLMQAYGLSTDMGRYARSSSMFGDAYVGRLDGSWV